MVMVINTCYTQMITDNIQAQ